MREKKQNTAKKREANFFVREVMDPPSVLISSKQAW